MKMGQTWPFALGKTNNIKQTQSSFLSAFTGVTAAKRMTMATSHQATKHEMYLSKDVWPTALIFLGT